eukprot:6213166-Pleurochrysis_carterae.AAC.1
MRGIKRDMSGRIFSFPGVDMGCPDLGTDSSFYPERLSHHIIPLRPSRESTTVPTVNTTHYWSNSACGWEPHIKRHDMIGSVWWHCWSIGYGFANQAGAYSYDV